MSEHDEENEYRAYFTLAGDFDPDEITAALGIVPSHFSRKGESPSRTKPVSHARWSLESRLKPEHGMEEQVIDVLEQLEPVSEQIIRLSRSYESCLQLVASFTNGQASCFLSVDLLRRTSDLHLPINFDPYDLLSSEEM